MMLCEGKREVWCSRVVRGGMCENEKGVLGGVCREREGVWCGLAW